MQIINDSVSVKKMSDSTELIVNDLNKNLKQVTEHLRSLKSKWQDSHYTNLEKLISEKDKDLRALLKEMDRHQKWLYDLHLKLKGYEEAAEL